MDNPNSFQPGSNFLSVQNLESVMLPFQKQEMLDFSEENFEKNREKIATEALESDIKKLNNESRELFLECKKIIVLTMMDLLKKEEGLEKKIVDILDLKECTDGKGEGAAGIINRYESGPNTIRAQFIPLIKKIGDRRISLLKDQVVTGFEGPTYLFSGISFSKNYKEAQTWNENIDLFRKVDNLEEDILKVFFREKYTKDSLCFGQYKININNIEKRNTDVLNSFFEMKDFIDLNIKKHKELDQKITCFKKSMEQLESSGSLYQEYRKKEEELKRKLSEFTAELNDVNNVKKKEIWIANQINNFKFSESEEENKDLLLNVFLKNPETLLCIDDVNFSKETKKIFDSAMMGIADVYAGTMLVNIIAMYSKNHVGVIDKGNINVAEFRNHIANSIENEKKKVKKEDVDVIQKLEALIKKVQKDWKDEEICLCVYLSYASGVSKALTGL